MVRTIFSSALLGAITIIGATLSSAPHAQAQAVVYCTGPGVPVGCVVRPAARARVIYCTSPGVPVGCVARPATRARVISCTRPGYPGGCVDRGARGVGVAPGVPGNRGGPVNRVGRF
jgi:hypothetical protein